MVMAGLRLFTSNRLEILAERLAEVLGKPLESSLAPEMIVVQSKGMERWVSMELARRHGICANLGFPFPNAFVSEILRRVFPDLTEPAPLDPRIMTWKIMTLLPSCIGRPGFESLRGYLGEPEEILRRLQLSERVADTFDQYLLFRPEMILQWEGGKGGHWQAVLWRELVKGNENKHRAALGKALFAALKDPSTEAIDLPERVSVFGISALPPFHIHVFAALCRFTEVNVFLMEPCRESWGVIPSKGEMKTTIHRQRRRDRIADDLHLERGNSLLASMGIQGREFFDLVRMFPREEIRLFEDPGEENLLSWIQSDILNLRDRTGGSEGKTPVADHDSSIQIHSCHSPMREIEILYDRLLDMFESDPSLTPRDILVMTPDIETYAPYIHAVFDIPMHDPRRIPFSIADRSIRKESEIVDSFLRILDLWGSRFGASQVLAVLESRAVQQRFGLWERDLDRIRRWIGETRIRWGIDRKGRGELGLPDFPENTWRAGLDRLLLGYALPGQDETMFAGILPYSRIEGAETAVLGEFLEFTEELFAHVRLLGHPRTLDAWSNTLTELLDRFFKPDETTERDMQVIRNALNELGAMKGLFDDEIEINVIKWHLAHHLKKEAFGLGFLTGNVTFCAMLPMRSIPFKIICLLGMNGDAYPRQSRPLGFDLIAKHPQPGDRSLRNEDRYLFLEAILSARETLYISYVGQNVQDNSPKPPSAVVCELMDTIEEGFEIPGKRILDHIVIRQRLQAFSPEYFKTKEKLFSYSGENFQAAQCLVGTREARPFISKALRAPEEEWKTVDLADLCSFFTNPARFLLNRRLGIDLEDKTSILEERESFEMRGLEKYRFEQSLVERRFAGQDLADLLPSAKASGLLPHGTVGDCLYGQLSQGVQAFVAKTNETFRGEPLKPLEVDLHIPPFELTGRIDNIFAANLVQHRYAKVKAKDRLRIWIHHLTLNRANAGGYPQTSMLVGLDPDRRDPMWAAWEYSPADTSEEVLSYLLETYWAGLVKPLHFFPESSWRYASLCFEKNRSEEDALRGARDTWEESDYSRGESEDPYYQRCFRNRDPLDPEFQHIAKGIFEPLIRHQMTVKA
jgi:exodeoxyribonuclease V gamma subunit